MPSTSTLGRRRTRHVYTNSSYTNSSSIDASSTDASSTSTPERSADVRATFPCHERAIARLALRRVVLAIGGDVHMHTITGAATRKAKRDQRTAARAHPKVFHQGIASTCRQAKISSAPSAQPEADYFESQSQKEGSLTWWRAHRMIRPRRLSLDQGDGISLAHHLCRRYGLHDRDTAGLQHCGGGLIVLNLQQLACAPLGQKLAMSH
eukprot:scaffold1806_cov240-Pinguiococcus_pyrenoidosus.AAC.21